MLNLNKEFRQDIQVGGVTRAKGGSEDTKGGHGSTTLKI
jgi:hypothetical protein